MWNLFKSDFPACFCHKISGIFLKDRQSRCVKTKSEFLKDASTLSLQASEFRVLRHSVNRTETSSGGGDSL